MLDLVIQFKGEAKKVIDKTVRYLLYLIAHNGSGSDSFIIFNSFPQWRTVVSLINNGSGIVSPKLFNSHLDQNNKKPQYMDFRCGRIQTTKPVKKIGKSYKLQPC